MSDGDGWINVVPMCVYTAQYPIHNAHSIVISRGQHAVVRFEARNEEMIENSAKAERIISELPTAQC